MITTITATLRQPVAGVGVFAQPRKAALEHRMRYQLAAFAISALLASTSQAAQAQGSVRAEVESLLVRLQASGCEFNRNGSWYSGAEAKNHLQRKLEHLENKTTLRSTEQFIELAASTSSSSGKAYQVKCGAAAAQPSAQWLTKELAAMRLASRQPAPGPK